MFWVILIIIFIVVCVIDSFLGFSKGIDNYAKRRGMTKQQQKSMETFWTAYMMDQNSKKK